MTPFGANNNKLLPKLFLLLKHFLCRDFYGFHYKITPFCNFFIAQNKKDLTFSSLYEL
jgi:hypothetical protein